MCHIMLYSICGDTSPLLMQVMWLVWLDKCPVGFPIKSFYLCIMASGVNVLVSFCITSIVGSIFKLDFGHQ
jgi:hypothetical protein